MQISERITHLDTVRGAAIMGILVMNSLSFALDDLAYFDIGLGTASPLDFALAVFGELFADQKFMGLFSLLFGASLLLFIERAEAKQRRAGWLSLWRNGILFIVGVAHMSLWAGDILTIYALCAPLLILLRRRSSGALIALGGITLSVALPLDWLLGQASDETLTAIFSDLEGVEASSLGFAFAAQVFARALGMMLIGMGLYRSGWLIKVPARSALLSKSLCAIFLGAALAAAGVVWTASAGFGLAAAMQGNLFNDLALLPMTLGYFGLLSWWDRHGPTAWVERVRAVGRMALTNYLTQTLICLAIIELIPSGWLSRGTLWLGVIAICALQLAWSAPWLSRFRFGPMEWLWRCATYRRRTPLRRRSGAR